MAIYDRQLPNRSSGRSRRAVSDRFSTSMSRQDAPADAWLGRGHKSGLLNTLSLCSSDRFNRHIFERMKSGRERGDSETRSKGGSQRRDRGAPSDTGKAEGEEKAMRIRPEAVKRGRELADDPCYPDDSIAKEIAKEITKELTEED